MDLVSLGIRLAIVAAIAAAIAGVLYGINHALETHYQAPIKLELEASRAETKTAKDANLALQEDAAKLRAEVKEQNGQLEAMQKTAEAKIATAQSALAAADVRQHELESTMTGLYALVRAPSKKGDPDVDQVLTDLAVERVRFNGPGASHVGAEHSGQGAGAGSLRIH